MNQLPAFGLVFLGGGLGSMARYGLTVAGQSFLTRFPVATLAANVLACILMGMLTARQAQGTLSDPARLLFATGFCGGFSTFSTFTAETWQRAEHGELALALLNIVVSLTACFVGLWMGKNL